LIGKYANNCVKMFLRPDNPPRPGRTPVFLFDREYFKDTPYFVEILTITGNVSMMQGTPKGSEKVVHIMSGGFKGGPYPKTNRKADEMLFFYGTDSNNLNDLGAHVEFHLGKGNDEEVFEFDEPRCVFVPRGVRHGPLYFTQFHRNFIIFDLITAPTRLAADQVTDFSFTAEDGKQT
jgi:hypothetical protein